LLTAVPPHDLVQSRYRSMKIDFTRFRLGTTTAAMTTYVVLAGLQRGLSLLLLPFFTKALSPSEYGAASILTVTSAVLLTFSATPLVSLIIRSTARKTDDSPALIRLIGIYFYFIVPIFFACIAAVFTFFVHDLFGVSGNIWSIEILSLGFLPALSVFGLFLAQAQEQIRRFATLSIFSVSVSLIFKILFVVVLEKGVLGWALADLAGASIAFVLAIFLVRLPKAQIRMSHLRYAVKFTIPLVPHSVSLWALMAISRPTLASVSNLEQVGFLSIGLNFAQFAGMILMETNRAALVRFSRETFPAPTHETYHVVKWQILAALLVPATVGCGIAVLGQRIVAEPYWPSLALSGVLLVGNAAYGIYLIPMNYLTQTAGQTKYSVFSSFSGACVLFVSLILVGSKFGSTGAAYATSGSYLVMAGTALIITMRRKLDIRWNHWFKNMPEITLAAGALACIAIALANAGNQGSSYILVCLSAILAVSSVSLTMKRPTPESLCNHA
jgi:O-antigen/teichoic acid export membrane protein